MMGVGESWTNKWISICCEQRSSTIPKPSENRQRTGEPVLVFLRESDWRKGVLRPSRKCAFCTRWIWVRSFSPSSSLEAPFRMPVQAEASHLEQQVKQVYRDPVFGRGNIEEISGERLVYRERPAPGLCSSIASTPVGLVFHKRPV